ncbi:patatin-like phospholipase family protein [Candidatus Falkowbacteria bacterium]|nr:patatin-like phospholipase family protein [Candidatus Falkowbacteria bacterium]
MTWEEKPRKRVGLALGGGFIRSAAAIGVLEVLEENNIQIDMISGCSSGAAVACSYANGTMDLLKKRLSEGRRRDYWKVIFEPTIPSRGFLKGERNRKFFEEFVGDKTFDQLNKKVVLTVTDLISMKEVIISEGPVGRAIQACTAVPGMFVPVKWNQMILVDGANFNLIPSKPLYDAGVDYVIAIYTSKSPNPITRLLSQLSQLFRRRQAMESVGLDEYKDLRIIELISRAIKLSVTRIKNFHHSSYNYDLLIKPDVENVRRWHVKKVDYLIHQGRSAAEEAIPQIKKDLGL